MVNILWCLTLLLSSCEKFQCEWSNFRTLSKRSITVVLWISKSKVQLQSKLKLELNLALCLKFELKMVPLQVNRFVLTWICVCPAAEATSKWTKRVQKLLCTFIFAVLILVLCTSSIHFAQCLIGHDSEEIVFMVLQITGILNAIYLNAAIFILRDKITQMLDNLTEIYNKCKQHFLSVSVNQQNKIVLATLH